MIERQLVGAAALIVAAVAAVAVVVAFVLSVHDAESTDPAAPSTSASVASSSEPPSEPLVWWQDREPLRGITVSGPDFGAGSNIGRGSGDGFSNRNPGTLWTNAAGGSYTYPSAESLSYLAERGLDVVRLTLRWERLQPVRLGELDATEVELLRDSVESAAAAGLLVIPTMMNYGAYWDDVDGVGVRRPIGSPEVPIAHFVDVWVRLADELSDFDNIAALGLMNEPIDLPEGAATWETATVAVTQALRSAGVSHTIGVPTYFWSNAHRVEREHPDGPWIPLELGPIRYEVHQYWSVERSGAYLDYDSELELALGQGWLARGDNDALTVRSLAELNHVISWLDGQPGWIGEVGWPNDSDSDRWERVAEAWFALADDAGLWVTVWTTGALWPADYHLLAYRSSDGASGAIDTVTPVGAVLERHL